MINREDMLELTRRMTLKRTHFTRIAGCYVDRDGEFDGSFNISFLKLTPAEKERHLNIAKQIPFAASNDRLVSVRFPRAVPHEQEMNKLLTGLKACGLKNDALLDVFYDQVMDIYKPGTPYSILFFHGAYDIPRKASSGAWQWESDLVYEYLIGAICPQTGLHESGDPDCGFLFPMYSDHAADLDHIAVYSRAVAGASLLSKVLRGM